MRQRGNDRRCRAFSFQPPPRPRLQAWPTQGGRHERRGRSSESVGGHGAGGVDPEAQGKVREEAGAELKVKVETLARAESKAEPAPEAAEEKEGAAEHQSPVDPCLSVRSWDETALRACKERAGRRRPFPSLH